jgi:hypothetical protein
MSEQEIFVGSRDQFVADVAVKLERLRIAAEMVEKALSQLREENASLAQKVDRQYEDFDVRTNAAQKSIDRLAHALTLHGMQLEQTKVDMKALNQRGSDPTQNVSYTTSNIISGLANRIEQLELRKVNRALGMRYFLMFTTIVLVGAISWDAFK